MKQPNQASPLLWGLTMLMMCFHSATLTAQQKIPGRIKVSIAAKNIGIGDVLKQAKQQTGINIFFGNALDKARAVTVNYKQHPLQKVLEELLTKNGIVWTYYDSAKEIIIGKEPRHPPGTMTTTGITVSGRVCGSTGDTLAGANVLVKGTARPVLTQRNGLFSFSNIPAGSILVISYIGYKTQEIPVVQNSTMRVVLQQDDNTLSAVVLEGYGTTPGRRYTGNIGRISGADIGRQPGVNPLASLQGRVAGLLITQTSGGPGGTFIITIRGLSSIGAAGLPFSIVVSNAALLIIDGVPFTSGNILAESSQVYAINTSIHPLANLNPADIESMEVLKDAVATSIYGTRGANGVILVTTKKGEKGKFRVQLTINSGISWLNNKLRFLQTQPYLQLRKQACINDQAPFSGDDLTQFDSTRYTDFRQQLLGGPSYQSGMQVVLSGGSEQTQFLFSAGYTREKPPYAQAPGTSDFGVYRPSFHTSVVHTSLNKKWKLVANAMFATFRGVLAGKDPFLLPGLFAPNYPALFDSAGNPVWVYNGAPISNPYLSLLHQYRGIPDNLSAGFTLIYKGLFPGLDVKLATGHNSFRVNESLFIPQRSLSPFTNETNSAIINNASINTNIVEPQLEYSYGNEAVQLQALAGGTLQTTSAASFTLSGKNFLPDDLSGLLAATNRTYENRFSNYHYLALFGRVNLSILDKYMFHVSGRRDGSSRFSPGQQYASFGAAGVAWVFQLPKILSYGKIRASIGTAGNDGLNGYPYLATYTPAAAYQGQPSLVPASPFNADYAWEHSLKKEAGVDLGFFQNSIRLSIALYENRTGNQLINYPLPSQTGFTTVTQNFDALVQNKGIEIELMAKKRIISGLSWTAAMNITFNRNKLLAFKNLEQSPYAAYLVIGEPITGLRGYSLKGVNPNTGVYEFRDLDNNKKLDEHDYVSFGNKAPDYYGGMNHEFSYKKYKLSLSFTFKKQLGLNDLSVYPLPGMGNYNVPAEVPGITWQKPGDHAKRQRLTQSSLSAAYEAATAYLPKSDGLYVDASYLRLKNICFAYTWQPKDTVKAAFKSAELSLQLQNFFTITPYKGPDPENPVYDVLPLSRTIMIRLTISF